MIIALKKADTPNTSLTIPINQTDDEKAYNRLDTNEGIVCLVKFNTVRYTINADNAIKIAENKFILYAKLPHGITVVKILPTSE